MYLKTRINNKNSNKMLKTKRKKKNKLNSKIKLFLK